MPSIQYKKPVQCQMYAVQVIDDGSGADLPNANEPLEESEKTENAEPKSETNNKPEEHSGLDDDSDGLEGSQYEDSDASYEEYDEYTMPLENNDYKVEYIWVSYEIDASTSSYLSHPDNMH